MRHSPILSPAAGQQEDPEYAAQAKPLYNGGTAGAKAAQAVSEVRDKQSTQPLPSAPDERAGQRAVENSENVAQGSVLQAVIGQPLGSESAQVTQQADAGASVQKTDHASFRTDSNPAPANSQAALQQALAAAAVHQGAASPKAAAFQQASSHAQRAEERLRALVMGADYSDKDWFYVDPQVRCTSARAVGDCTSILLLRGLAVLIQPRMCQQSAGQRLRVQGLTRIIVWLECLLLLLRKRSAFEVSF